MVDATNTVAQALPLASSLTDVREKSRLLVAIAGVQLQIGAVAGARESVGEARQALEGVHLDTYDERMLSPLEDRFCEVAVAQAATEGLGAATATLDEAWEAVRGVERVNSRIGYLCVLAETQAKIGDRDGAVIRYADARAAARQNNDPGNYYRDDALATIAISEAKVGEVGVARRTAREIGEKSRKARALTEIVKGQAEKGDVAGALQTAAILPDGIWAGNVVYAIAHIRAGVGDVAGARQAIAVEQQIADRISSSIEKTWALSGVAGVQLETGDVSEALATLENGRIAAMQLTDFEKQAEALGSVVFGESKVIEYQIRQRILRVRSRRSGVRAGLRIRSAMRIAKRGLCCILWTRFGLRRRRIPDDWFLPYNRTR